MYRNDDFYCYCWCQIFEAGLIWLKKDESRVAHTEKILGIVKLPLLSSQCINRMENDDTVTLTLKYASCFFVFLMSHHHHLTSVTLVGVGSGRMHEEGYGISWSLNGQYARIWGGT